MMNKQDDAMAALMQGLSGKARIADVMDSFGYSRRHLQRLVQQRLGCSMKTIQKIQRINQAVSLLKEQKLTLHPGLRLLMNFSHWKDGPVNQTVRCF